MQNPTYENLIEFLSYAVTESNKLEDNKLTNCIEEHISLISQSYLDSNQYNPTITSFNQITKLNIKNVDVLLL